MPPEYRSWRACTKSQVKPLMFVHVVMLVPVFHPSAEHTGWNIADAGAAPTSTFSDTTKRAPTATATAF
jgi:hypothetical protein